MLPGLMSRWMTPCWNAYSSARMHLKMISTTLLSGSRLVTSECASSVVPAHVLHHQVAVVGLDHRVEDVDDVRVVELAGERGLGEERLVHHALGLRVGMLVEQEHLDRDLAVGERVAREVHAAGRAACRSRAGSGTCRAGLRRPANLTPARRWAVLESRCSSSAFLVGLAEEGVDAELRGLRAVLARRARGDHDDRDRRACADRRARCASGRSRPCAASRCRPASRRAARPSSAPARPRRPWR